MSRGGQILAVGTGLAALFSALFLGAYFGALYSPDHKHYQAVGHRQETSSTYEGPSESLHEIAGLPDPAERAIANPAPYSGEDHERRDLAAQEGMAVWAFWMVVVSGGALGLSLLATYLIFLTFQATRKAAETSEKTYRAFVDTERARLTIVVEHHATSARGVEARIVATNIGKSACVVTQVMSRWQQTNLFNESRSVYLAKEPHMLIGSSESKRVGLSDAFELSPAYLRGIVKYSSPLGEHRSHFCFQAVARGRERPGEYLFRDMKGTDWPDDT